MATNEQDPNEWVDILALKEELYSLDKNRDIWVPEPGYQKEKETPPPASDVVEIEVDASGKGEAQFDWDDDSEGLVVKGADQSDEDFNKEVQAIASDELDADEAYIKMYQEMLKEGRKDGDDPLKKDVALNSILNLLLEQSETGTRNFEEFINDRQINSFEDVFFEILAQGNTIIRDTDDPDLQNEVRNLMNIMKRYKHMRSKKRNLISRKEGKDTFARKFSCGIDSHVKCRKLEEAQEEEKTGESEEAEEKTEETEEKTEETEDAPPSEPKIEQKEMIIIDETKDLQKGIKWLLSYIPTDVDDQSLNKIGKELIDSSIKKIEKFDEDFNKDGSNQIEEKFKQVKEQLNKGESMTDTDLFNHIQNLKKTLNNKIDVLLTKENRDQEATALARIEDSLKQFDTVVKDHQGSAKEGGNNIMLLDHDVEEKLEGIKNQLKSDKRSDQADWKAFRKNIKELINYELSNVKKNEATKKINHISTSAKNILDSLGQEINNGTIQYTVKESGQNLIDDLKALKSGYNDSGLIVTADQYKDIVKEFFSPVKELLDDSGRARVEIDADKFNNGMKAIQSFTSKISNRIPHTTPGKEKKQFKWIKKDLPEGTSITPQKEDKNKVKYEDGYRYELVEIKKIKPEYLDSAESLIIDGENSGQGAMKEFKSFLNSMAFKNKMTKIMDRLQKAYFFANEQTGDVLQDTNMITRLKQGYYLHKPVARLLRSIILARHFFDEKDLILKNKKARKLGLKSTFEHSLEQKDSDLMLYLQTRLAHSIKHDFKSKTLENSYNSLINQKI